MTDERVFALLVALVACAIMARILKVEGLGFRLGDHMMDEDE